MEFYIFNRLKNLLLNQRNIQLTGYRNLYELNFNFSDVKVDLGFSLLLAIWRSI